ncbi:MAG TPA: TIGR03000 domain-containing protein [Gemmataceae bacterium]|nr:TIGR03000 domain-containing protein [Gemmataceae bacterium]
MLASRALLPAALLIVTGLCGEAQGQTRAWSVGVGVGYGYGYGPYWGIYPNYYNGFYGNGLSMYGPPVPTYKPIPGVFGGGDSQFFGPPPIYPGWVSSVYVPLTRPSPLPAAVVEAPVELPAPAAALTTPTPLEVEVRLPNADARLFVDGTEIKGAGISRKFATPPLETTAPYTYEIRAAWAVDGLTTTHTKQVTGRAGDKLVVEFK